MRISKLAESELVADERDSSGSSSSLHVGDQVMASVTAQIRIDGQDAWVKYGAVSVIRPNETPEAADSRVIAHVSRQVIAVAEEAAARIMEAGS